MPKDFLCLVTAHGRERSAALTQGIALGSAYKSFSQFVAVVLGPPRLSNVFRKQFVDELIGQAEAKAAKDSRELAAQIVETAKKHAVDAKVMIEQRSLPEAAAAIEQLALNYDLTIVDRPDSFADAQSALFETVLFASGRPVLAAVGSHIPQRFRRALLAWDGSVHATRAISAALSLFPDIGEIVILTVVGEKDLELVPGAEIAAHIRRHGIATKVACIDFDPPDGDAGAGIAKFAKTKGCDLIVMGGYGHSRYRELILGGVTEHLSRKSDLPLLLVH